MLTLTFLSCDSVSHGCVSIHCSVPWYKLIWLTVITDRQGVSYALNDLTYYN